jgi:hypothetical protein
MKPGEALQQLVFALERAITNNPIVRLDSPKRLPDRDTGRLREHDVVLTFNVNHHELIVAMECRDRSLGSKASTNWLLPELPPRDRR